MSGVRLVEEHVEQRREEQQRHAVPLQLAQIGRPRLELHDELRRHLQPLQVDRGGHREVVQLEHVPHEVEQRPALSSPRHGKHDALRLAGDVERQQHAQGGREAPIALEVQVVEAACHELRVLFCSQPRCYAIIRMSEAGRPWRGAPKAANSAICASSAATATSTAGVSTGGGGAAGGAGAGSSSLFSTTSSCTSTWTRGAGPAVVSTRARTRRSGDGERLCGRCRFSPCGSCATASLPLSSVLIEGAANVVVDVHHDRGHVQGAAATQNAVQRSWGRSVSS